MRRLVIIEILNVLVIPIVYDILLLFYMPENYRQRDEQYYDELLGDLSKKEMQTAFYIDLMAYTEELLLRFLLQAIVVVILFQWRSDAATIVKTFLSSLKLTGRTKFKHYLYDLGLRNVLAVTMFTLGLCCAVVVPLATPLCAVFFALAYGIDKYNLFFVYPIDFESQMMNRKVLVKSTLCAILMFQAITTTVLSSIIDQIKTIYLFTALFIQLLVCILIFEFIRNPWKGARLTVEEAEEEMQHKMFEEGDVEAYDFGGESQLGGDTTIVGLKR